MSKLYVISDLHLGHRGILKWRTQFKTPDEHDDHIVKNWNAEVTKYDTVYVLGDVAFSKKALSRLSEMNGKKILIAGNHDTLGAKEYLKYFVDIRGFWKKNNVWLSHCPIHEKGARGVLNIHGHLHSENLAMSDDGEEMTHVNVSCEQTDYTPVEFKSLVETVKMINETHKEGASALLEMDFGNTIH